MVQSAYRTFQTHIPPSYSGSSPYPLVIALHGGVGNATQMQYMSKLSIKSNTANFIIVYPEGIKDQYGIRTWNGGGCCGHAVAADIDDVGFISTLIDSLRLQYNIDTTRIYATGISNGAIMCYRLACELSNRIAAIAPVSGTLEDTLYTCSPLRSVPIIQFHSTLDSNIYLQGGAGQGISGYSFNSVNYGLQLFSIYNNCMQGNDSSYYSIGNSFFYKKRWYNCSCNTENILYVTGDGGHSWPMGNQGLYQGADAPSQIINANDTMWNFFCNYTLNCVPNFVTNFHEKKCSVTIYPNPISTSITLQITGNKGKPNYELEIFNIFGKAVYQAKVMNSKTEIQLDFPNGIYFLYMRSNNFILTKKLEVIR